MISQENVGERIDKLLVRLNTGITRSQIQRWITDKNVTVNDILVKSNYKCQLNDRVKWEIPEAKPLALTPEPIPLSIVYEDRDLLIINKPAGMVVHPSKIHPKGTLVNALLHHVKQLSTIGGEQRPGIVHRLDKDTSGLLVVAKNDETHQMLAQQLQNRTMERIYEAIVEGDVDHDEGVIDAPIGRNPERRVHMAVVDSGKEALTHFNVIKRYAAHTHLACRLTTGRTHQIRVHLSYINHPIVGDPIYNERHHQQDQKLALFSKMLSFEHPHRKEWLTFEIDTPESFQHILSNIEKRS